MTAVVRIKPGVTLDPLTPTLARLICAADQCARMQGVDMTITCGREGHPPDDPHTRGAAIDLRVSDLTPELTLRSYQYLRSILGDVFTVLYEVRSTPVEGSLRNIATINPQASASHFHLQHRIGAPPYGDVYPPADGIKKA